VSTDTDVLAVAESDAALEADKIAARAALAAVQASARDAIDAALETVHYAAWNAAIDASSADGQRSKAIKRRGD